VRAAEKGSKITEVVSKLVIKKIRISAHQFARKEVVETDRSEKAPENFHGLVT